MLKSDDLKDWLHRDLPRLDKILLILASQTESLTVSEIKKVAHSAGFRTLDRWNISSILLASKGKAIRVVGWEITEVGKSYLRSLGVSSVSPAAMQVAVDLREHLSKLNDAQTKSFVEEAIKCHELELYRAAIVMSWLGAVDLLQKHVHKNRLYDFNAAASACSGKWKAAVTQDDIGKMKEADFLDRIEGLSIIGKNVKSQLKSCLDLRNACGHPNSLQLSANKSAAHLEVLLLNVFEKFC